MRTRHSRFINLTREIACFGCLMIYIHIYIYKFALVCCFFFKCIRRNRVFFRDKPTRIVDISSNSNEINEIKEIWSSKKKNNGKQIEVKQTTMTCSLSSPEAKITMKAEIVRFKSKNAHTQTLFRNRMLATKGQKKNEI